jgi:predicted DNA-binding transcriptional regulator AlpA
MGNNPTSKSPKPLLSVEEAAILLGETRSTLYRAIKAGDFPPHL